MKTPQKYYPKDNKIVVVNWALISYERRRQHISQATMAEMLGINRATYIQKELNEQPVNALELEYICRILNIDLVSAFKEVEA